MTQAMLARRLEISEATLGHFLADPPRRPVPEGFYLAVARILNDAGRHAIEAGHMQVFKPDDLRPFETAVAEEAVA